MVSEKLYCELDDRVFADLCHLRGSYREEVVELSKKTQDIFWGIVDQEFGQVSLKSNLRSLLHVSVIASEPEN